MRNPELIERLLGEPMHPSNLYDLIAAHKAMKHEILFLRNQLLASANRIYDQSELLSQKAESATAV